jgi:hypothetical protein
MGNVLNKRLQRPNDSVPVATTCNGYGNRCFAKDRKRQRLQSSVILCVSLVLIGRLLFLLFNR